MNHCCPCLLKSLLPRLSRLVTEITPKTQLQGLPTTLFSQGVGGVICQYPLPTLPSPPKKQKTKQQKQKQRDNKQTSCKLSHDNLSRLQIKCNQSLIYISIFMGVPGAILRTQLSQEFLACVIGEN